MQGSIKERSTWGDPSLDEPAIASPSDATQVAKTATWASVWLASKQPLDETQKQEAIRMFQFFVSDPSLWAVLAIVGFVYLCSKFVQWVAS